MYTYTYDIEPPFEPFAPTSGFCGFMTSGRRVSVHAPLEVVCMLWPLYEFNSVCMNLVAPRKLFVRHGRLYCLDVV